MKRIGTRLAAAIVLAATFGGSARADLINGGFETGTFSGWSTIGNATIETDVSIGTPPAEGTYHALAASAGGSVDAASLDAFLGLSSGTLGSLGVFQGSAFSQTLSVNAGDILTFSWNFLTTEDLGGANNDFAFFTVVPLGGPALLSDTFSPFLSGSNSRFIYETGYFPNTVIFSVGGVVTLGFGVADRSDGLVESGLLIDNVHVRAVPEPSSLGLAALGLVVVAGVGRSRMRRASAA